MNERPTNNQIRRYCDGETAPDEAAAMEQYIQQHPEERRRVAFERALKGSISRALQSEAPGAPVGLADRIRQAILEAEPEATRAATPAPDDAAPPADPAERARPLRINYFAVAACLVLIGSAILVGILGPRVDDRVDFVDGAQEAAIHVAEEHVSCSNSPEFLADRVAFLTEVQASFELTRLLGQSQPVRVFDLSEQGYAFTGGGECKVPGTDDELAGHLIYERMEGEPGLVTIHVVPDYRQFDELSWDADAGGTDVALVPRSSGCANDVSFLRSGGYIYIIVMCHADGLEEITGVMAQQSLAAVGQP